MQAVQIAFSQLHNRFAIERLSVNHQINTIFRLILLIRLYRVVKNHDGYDSILWLTALCMSNCF
ncbi:hypothetical protein CW304_05785 [Bacillus sp. UFRGS-B20]|nr:hypothetical protein CW304_05785 [Bacillus sp. UFRGS-B20]